MDTKYRKKITVNATPKQVWDAFLNHNNLERWLGTGSKKGMKAQENYEFEWDINGRTIGKIKSLHRPSERIIIEWRIDEPSAHERWPIGHFALIDMELGDEGEETLVFLEITNIPDTEQDEVRKIWVDHILYRLNEFMQSDKNKERLEEAYD